MQRSDPDAGKDWRQEEKTTSEDERHEIEQALGDSEGQGSLACCRPWGCKESNMTEGLKNNKEDISAMSLKNSEGK